MGLLYNENTCYLDTGTLYNQEEGDSGRWFTGLGQAFIEFPRAVMSIKFNSEEDASGPTISAKTYTGTSVALDMAFQFQLVRTPEAVAKVHATFGTDFARFYMKYARQVVRDVVSDHVVTDLWEKREIMGTAMRDALNLRLSEKWAEVTGFQVLSLTIPTEIQSAIESTSVAFQKIGEARFEKEAATVRAETRRAVAEKTSEITVLQAEAQAQALLADVTAKATALNITIQGEVDAMLHIKSRFAFNSEEMLRYMWLDSIVDNNAQKMTLSVGQPAVTKLA